METIFNVPQREEVSTANQQIFYGIKATIVLIGDKSITNLLHSVTKVPVDFPSAKELA